MCASFPSRFVVGAWTLYSFIVLSAYSGNLKSHLTSHSTYPSLKTLEEVVKSDLRIDFMLCELVLMAYYKEFGAANWRKALKYAAKSTINCIVLCNSDQGGIEEDIVGSSTEPLIQALWKRATFVRRRYDPAWLKKRVSLNNNNAELF